MYLRYCELCPTWTRELLTLQLSTVIARLESIIRLTHTLTRIITWNDILYLCGVHFINFLLRIDFMFPPAYKRHDYGFTMHLRHGLRGLRANDAITTKIIVMKTANENREEAWRTTSGDEIAVAFFDAATRGIKSKIFDKMHFNTVHLHNRRNLRACASHVMQLSKEEKRSPSTLFATFPQDPPPHYSFILRRNRKNSRNRKMP